MFRPDDQFTHACSMMQPTLEVSTGPLITEIKQTFAEWASHIIRLTKGSPYIEVEWTAGPIPWNQGATGKQGKELVVKFSSGIASAGTFYTDSNVSHTRTFSCDEPVPCWGTALTGLVLAGARDAQAPA